MNSIHALWTDSFFFKDSCEKTSKTGHAQRKKKFFSQMNLIYMHGRFRNILFD